MIKHPGMEVSAISNTCNPLVIPVDDILSTSEDGLSTARRRRMEYRTRRLLGCGVGVTSPKCEFVLVNSLSVE